MLSKVSSVAKLVKGIPFIDLWSIFYLLLVYSFTLIFEELHISMFAVYFICALPFLIFRSLDKFACICLLLSTMAYFFIGGDEGVWSLYTILALLVFISVFINSKINFSFKPLLCFLWLMLAIVLSYTHSQFGYTTGMYAMLCSSVPGARTSLGSRSR